VKKLGAILWKELLLGFTDPVVLLYAIAMPLAISALIELAFGDLVLGRGVPDAEIAVGIVNGDQGGQWANFGQIVSSAIISGSRTSAMPGELSLNLFDARQVADVAQARRMVEREELVVALFIPADFSRALAAEDAGLDLYINDRYIFRGAAFQDAVETLANLISAGEITARTAVNGLMAEPRARAELRAGKFDQALAELVREAVAPASSPIQVRASEPINGLPRLDLAHYLAAAIAIFFAGFTGLLAGASLLQERAQWTLQRMRATPTPEGMILGGKLLGTYLIGLIQMGVLLGSVVGLERLRAGVAQSTLALDFLGLAMLILALLAAATCFGLAVAGWAGTFAQAASYGRGLLVLMGLAGGIFFPAALLPQPLQMLSRATFHFWAMDGYLKLALGQGAGAIVPHVAVLAGMAVLFFVLGAWGLRRQVA